MKKVIEKGERAFLIEEKLTDGSLVYNVEIVEDAGAYSVMQKLTRLELEAPDEKAAMKLFRAIEDYCIGVS